jgi:HEAT repeat protein
VSFEAYLGELADPARSLAVSKLINLSTMRPEEVSLFTPAWLEMDVGTRRRVMKELIDLVEDNVELNFEAVFLVALADVDADVRQYAVKGLWEYEGNDLINPLIHLLESDADPRVQAEAALSLGRFVLQAEFDILRAADAKHVETALRRIVGDAAEVAEVRGRALESIGARSGDWVRDLIRVAFEDDERRLRVSAVHAMGRNSDAAWLPDLISELDSDDAEMRFEAARACGAIADETATPHLLRRLDDEDHEVQEAAIDALGQIGGAKAKEALHQILAGDNERLREAAVSALSEIDLAEDPLAFTLRE